MKNLISIFALVLSAQFCFGQHYATQTEMDALSAIVQDFEVNYSNLMIEKDASAAKQIKKDIFLLSAQMRNYSDLISASVTIDEMEGMGGKRASMLDHQNHQHKLIKMTFTRAQADKLSQCAHIMMNVKDDLRAQNNRINLADASDLALIQKFRENLMAFHEIQSTTFKKAFKKATS